MMKNRFIYFLVFMLLPVVMMAQYKLNFGLRQQQPASELPKGKAPLIPAIRKSKTDMKGVVTPAGEQQYRLSDGWEMLDGKSVISSGKSVFDMAGNRADWYHATVPGTVLTTLVEQGVYPDPYFGLNNLHIPDSLCRKDWWYRINFDMPVDIDGKVTRLLLNGINYKADIWLNGKPVGDMAGAFKRGRFAVSDVVKPIGNVLAVHIFPPNNPGIPHEENEKWFGPNGGALCLDGPTFISSEGWDWIPGIRDRNIGIWQDVLIQVGGEVTMDNHQVITDLMLPDTTVADITVKTELHNEGNLTKNIQLNARIGNILVKKLFEVPAHGQVLATLSPKEFAALRLKNPKLWWPNGYGSQPLYNLDLELMDEGKVTESRTVRFGIRELSYQLTVDTSDRQDLRVEYSPTDVQQKGCPLFDYVPRRELKGKHKWTTIGRLRDEVDAADFKKIDDSGNPFLVIKVNGQPVFCRGGNWGMDDGMKRVSRERLEPYIRLHKEENFNMIRNWTGESTEEAFYELCDEYGMLVWNDFSISTEFYNLDPLDEALFLANATDIVKRYRNHPSIAIWCPRNEGYAPEGLEEQFQKMIAREDGTRHYHGNSRSLNLMASGPWSYIKEPLRYYTEYAEGFNSELGTPSVPAYSTVKKFIPEKDLWPIGDVWYYHDLHIGSFEWKDYIEDVNRMGNASCRDAQEFCRRAQVINYNSHRFMFEAWNHKMWNNTSGLLLWMSHPAWPSMIWQTYSYDYETHGSFYGCKKACEPVHIQWNMNDRKIAVANIGLTAYRNAVASFSVYDLNGKLLYDRKMKISPAANALSTAEEVIIPQDIDKLVLVRLQLKDSKGQLLSVNDYWYEKGLSCAPVSLGSVGPVHLQASVKRKMNAKDNRCIVNMKNTSGRIAAFVKLNVVDAITGEPVLPAYTSEGYFNLLPGESKIVDIDLPESTSSDKLKLAVEQLNGESTVYDVF